MIIEESRFTDIYHKYQLFEVDALTDACKQMIDVSIEDCYMLTTTIVDDSGNVNFIVLAIGPTKETCNKGLEILEPLAVFTSFELQDFDFEIVKQPTFQTQVKASQIFEMEDCTREVAAIRKIRELDASRDIHYPDILSVNFIVEGKFHQYLVEAKEYNSRYIEGTMLKEPERNIGVHEHEVVEVLPILLNNQMQLISATSKLEMNEEVLGRIKDFVNEIFDDFPDVEKRKKS